MIELLALTLLLMRVRATQLIWRVIVTQRNLMKHPVDKKNLPLIDDEIIGYRKTLHWLTLGLAGSNVIPIIFDVFILLRGFGVIAETVSTQPLLIIYTVSNALAALLAAILIARIYRNAVQIDKSHEESDHTLMNDEKQSE